MKPRWVNYLLQLDESSRMRRIREDLVTFGSMSPSDQERVFRSFSSPAAPIFESRLPNVRTIVISSLLVGLIFGYVSGLLSRPRIVIAQHPVREEMTLIEALAKDPALYALFRLPPGTRNQLVKLVEDYEGASALQKAMRTGPFPCVRSIWLHQLTDEVSRPGLPSRICLVSLDAE